MSGSETATAISKPINDIGGRFMLSGRTFRTGNEYGFGGTSFYFCGRGGVLGDVDAKTVVAEFGFFEPTGLTTMWESGASVMSRGEAAQRFIECGYEWARARLPVDAPFGRFTDLVRSALESVDGDQPLLFSEWSKVEWPADDVSRAMLAIHLLRELRGGHHVRAIRSEAIDPHAAVMVQGGEGVASLFGWPEPHPEVEEVRPRWLDAEETTNAAVADILDGLSDSEQLDLIKAIESMRPS